ncbi:helix-turn-helix domain-containing protein [Streptomyces sp. NPDC060001]|uniref:helix-turn-helix domain-containing protein n=1 Tax=Streptomyces sp. NPDC060001 TaxID=3347032 RepID=UPI003699BFC2
MRDGSPVSEVAVRYGVSRQTIYTWKSKYDSGGLEGLREESRRPRSSPTRIRPRSRPWPARCGGRTPLGRPADRLRNRSDQPRRSSVTGDGASRRHRPQPQGTRTIWVLRRDRRATWPPSTKSVPGRPPARYAGAQVATRKCD